MFGRGDIETRVAKLERQIGELIAEFRAARANFLMTVNQMGKFHEAMDAHVHTMTDDGGKGTVRPQADVINIVHELVQVLEQESNHLRVDLNAGREVTGGLDQRLQAVEAAISRLCSAAQEAFDATRVFDTHPSRDKP